MNMIIIRGKKGVTLIEVMVVVAIVGFLAAIAIPAYNDYVTRSRRSDAFTALETVRAAQEMYRAEKGFYSGGFADLAGCDTGMAGSDYSVDLDRSVSSTQYTVIATPQNKQAGDLFLGTDENGDQYDCTPGTCNHANLRTITNGWQQKSWEELR